MQKTTTIIKIRGSGVTPETVRASDLASILLSFEKAITDTPQSEGVVDGADESGHAIVSLIGIESSSEMLIFKILKPFVPAVAMIAQAIQAQNFGAMPTSSQEQFHQISTLVAKRGWSFEFQQDKRNKIPPAIVSQEQPVPAPEIAYASGTKTIRGYLIRIGGATPKAVLRLANGSNLTAGLSRDLARTLATKLYEDVYLEGECQWRLPGRILEKFTITKVIEFEQISLVSAFKELADICQGEWGKTDPDSYVRWVREGKSK